ASADEIVWGFRKLLEELAQRRPLVCVFDDIQWGEETFLDLVEHVALLSSGAPLLLLCLARPELAERRPHWPVALRLEPLPGDGQIAPRLASLVRKELLRPAKAQLPGDDAFRFRHLLMRDAAYEALPKAIRAELHERFASWLEERAADLVELDEILGFHLEQA